MTDRAFMSLWLAHMRAPGEEIIADVKVFSGPGVGWDLPAALVALAGAYAGLQHLFGSAAGNVPAWLRAATALVPGWTVAVGLVRKSGYLAVTNRQVILVRMNWRHEPVRVIASLPLASATLRTRRTLVRRVVLISPADGGRITVDGRDRASLRLKVTGRAPQRHYEAILEAVRAGGGAIDLPLTLAAVPAGPA